MEGQEGGGVFWGKVIFNDFMVLLSDIIFKI